MAHTGCDIALATAEQAIATPLAAGKPFMIGDVSAEWIVPQTVNRNAVMLYFHGGGFRMGSVASHRDLIARIAEADQAI